MSNPVLGPQVVRVSAIVGFAWAALGLVAAIAFSIIATHLPTSIWVYLPFAGKNVTAVSVTGQFATGDLIVAAWSVTSVVLAIAIIGRIIGGPRPLIVVASGVIVALTVGLLAPQLLAAGWEQRNDASMLSQSLIANELHDRFFLFYVLSPIAAGVSAIYIPAHIAALYRRKG